MRGRSSPAGPAARRSDSASERFLAAATTFRVGAPGQTRYSQRAARSQRSPAGASQRASFLLSVNPRLPLHDSAEILQLVRLPWITRNLEVVDRRRSCRLRRDHYDLCFRLHSLVHNGAAEDESEHRGGGHAAGARCANGLLAGVLDRADDHQPLSCPERRRLLCGTCRDAAQLLREAAVSILTLIATIDMRNDLRRFVGLHVIRFEQICFAIVLRHRKASSCFRIL